MSTSVAVVTMLVYAVMMMSVVKLVDDFVILMMVVEPLLESINIQYELKEII